MHTFLKKFPLFTMGTLLASSIFLVFPFSLFDRFEYPKYISFLVFTFVLFVFHLIFSSWQKITRVPRLVWTCLILFLVGQSVAFIFSTDQSLSFGGALFRYEGYITQLFYVLWFLCTFLFFANTESKHTHQIFSFLVWLLVGVSGFAVFSLTHFFTLFDPATFENRIFGTLGNPNYLASCVAALFPFFLFEFRNRARILWGGTLFFTVVLLLTGSRSALVALAVSAGLIPVLFDIKISRAKFFGYIKKLSMAALGIFFVLFCISFPTLQRFSWDAKNFTSFGTRFDLWKAGIQLYAQHPFTGVGQDMIQSNITRFLSDTIRLNTDSYVDRVHSEPLDMLVMNGLFSFIGSFGLFVTLLVYTLKKHTRTVMHIIIPTVFSLSILFVYHLLNFSTITTNVLWYFLLGFLTSKLVDSLKVSTDNLGSNLNCDILTT